MARHLVYCPLARTMVLGNVSQKAIDLGATVSEGLTAALEGVKPGMFAEDVERIWAKTIAKSGFVKIRVLVIPWA